MKQTITLFSILGALLLAEPALASAPPPADDSGGVIELYNVHEERADRIAETFSEEDPTCPNYELGRQIVIPVTHDEFLVGYAFITPRFCFSRGVNRFQVVNRMHFIFDGMVRAAHRTPFVRIDNETVDQSATNEALLAAARSVVGDGRLERIDLLGSDVRYMR